MMTGAKAITVCITAVTLLAAPAQKPTHLVDGKPFTVTGRLEVKFRGWRSTLVVQTNKVYIADFGEEADPKRVSEIELNSQGNGDLLAKHDGETVTASG